MKEMTHKKFVFILLGTISAAVGVFLLGLILILASTGNSAFENKVILENRLEKLHKSTDIKTIVIGDSSAGNAIDGKHLSTLLGHRAENLALTASFGVTGDYNMLRHALNSNNKIENVLIIHSLDFWDRPVSVQGYYDTLGDLSPQSNILGENNFQRGAHKNFSITNFILRFPVAGTDRIENDFLKQDNKKFSNGRKIIRHDSALPNTIQEQKLNVLRHIDALCDENKLTCIYFHGPIHNDFVQASEQQAFAIIAAVRQVLDVAINVDIIFNYPNEYMGNTIDHIDPQYKKEVTENYFSVIEVLLNK